MEDKKANQSEIQVNATQKVEDKQEIEDDINEKEVDPDTGKLVK